MIALDFSTFLGRFHPVIVHLPIGFLLLAIVFEWLQKRKEATSYHSLVSTAWFLGALSAILAAFCGWLLANGGDYPESELFWHRWLGVGLAVAATVGWWIKREPGNYSKVIHKLLSAGIVLILVLEGHLGGNITHGEDYLVEYAPEPLKGLFSKEKPENEYPSLSDVDTVLIYPQMVYPILESKCVACHNNKEQRGGLNMEDLVAFQEGGDNGPVIAAGNPLESELFRRVTLSPSSEKYMPPRGEPLSYNEIQVLHWWISQGADPEKVLNPKEVQEGVKPVLLGLYQLDTEIKPWYASVSLEPLDSLNLNKIRENGFSIKSLGAENNLLDLKFSGDSLTAENLAVLGEASEHITWLSLAGSNVQDDWLEPVAAFTNLTRLQLEKTSITDAGVSKLQGLEHLEALNLYGTQVTDDAMESIAALPALKRVYLWGTKVSPKAINELKQSNTDLEVIGGINGQ
ncbi:c-type cytochrome domain-containing protein [Poritiphilus flavus]|uniref:Uncharacterized protein n=1 Tax=Poritiphilus flavus TaxID=2697053 RepID=A0A6L9E9H6_9FLAO|nr:c-type cytochrome domain-containing protein [Poritiphilus flavus]NAS11370.1 hypothetical protein [Poritiphilus flavus]